MDKKGPYDLAFMWPYSWPFYKVNSSNFMLIFFELTTQKPAIPALQICIFLEFYF